MSVRLAGVLWMAGMVAGSGAMAQAPSGYSQFRDPAVTPTTATAPSYARCTGQNNPAINFFGLSRSQRYTQPAPRAATPAPALQPVAANNAPKPYATLRQSSNISPYLNLDAREDEFSLPNYYAFVRPQLDQQQFNHTQQLENRRMQQQLRMAAVGASLGAGAGGGLPTTGHGTQFMNAGSFYPAVR